MKKNYHAPQLRCFHLQGGSPMFAVPSSLKVDGTKETSDNAGGWSKKFWGLAEDDEEDDSEFPWE